MGVEHGGSRVLPGCGCWTKEEAGASRGPASSWEARPSPTPAGAPCPGVQALVPHTFPCSRWNPRGWQKGADDQRGMWR